MVSREVALRLTAVWPASWTAGLRPTRLHKAADFRLRSQRAALTSVTPERDLILRLMDFLCVPF